MSKNEARNAGVAPSKIVDANKDDIEAVIDLERAMRGPEIEPVAEHDDRSLNDLVQDERFMQHVLDVTFSEPRDENDFLTARVGVNGIHYEYPRNNSVCKVPRYAVEVLARSRVQRVRTVETKLEDGARAYKPMVTESTTYPFAVINDPAGEKGRRWLQRVVSERLS